MTKNTNSYLPKISFIMKVTNLNYFLYLHRNCQSNMDAGHILKASPSILVYYTKEAISFALMRLTIFFIFFLFCNPFMEYCQHLYNVLRSVHIQSVRFDLKLFNSILSGKVKNWENITNSHL